MVETNNMYDLSDIEIYTKKGTYCNWRTGIVFNPFLAKYFARNRACLIGFLDARNNHVEVPDF